MGASVRFIVAVIAVLLVGACAAQTRAPAPAQPYTDLSPKEVKVKSDPDWLAAGFGAVWLKRPEGFVDRIEAATATVAAAIRVHETDTQPCEGIGSGATAVWACDTGNLVAIDPETNGIAEPINAGKIAVQGRLVTAAGRVWVLTGAGDSLVGIDERSGAMGDPIALPVACNDLGGYADVIYVVCEAADRVLRIDIAGGTVTAQAEVESPNWLSAAASGVWVTAGNDLLGIDPVSLKTLRTVTGMGTGQTGSIWADASGVWVRKFDPFLTRIDAAGSVRRTISAPFQTGGDVIGEGDHVWVTAIDERLVIRLTIPAES